jgi:hypothetical protein
LNYGRLDDNQTEIVQQLRRCCVSVQSLASVGKGCPDILVGFRGQNWLFEIKNPKQPAGKRKLTKDEDSWHLNWRGRVYVVMTFNQIAEIIGCTV